MFCVSFIFFSSHHQSSTTTSTGFLNLRGLFSHTSSPDPAKEHKLMSMNKWEASPMGQHIQLGIAENNLFTMLTAAGMAAPIFGQRFVFSSATEICIYTALHDSLCLHDSPCPPWLSLPSTTLPALPDSTTLLIAYLFSRLLPVGTLYDPFIARGLDALNYGCYVDSRFMVVATPSGISLGGEGYATDNISIIRNCQVRKSTELCDWEWAGKDVALCESGRRRM